MKKTSFTVSDGKLVLCLQSAEEGGYVVTSPLVPELITEAETLEEAFENARDAANALRGSRAETLTGIKLCPASIERGEGIPFDAAINKVRKRHKTPKSS